MNTPLSTYRLQLTGQFGFAEAAAVVPYLAALGISTVYCSPVFQARAGSSHGYDATDPTRFSAQLGGSSGWKELCDEARRHRMTLLVDIVPNHMAASVETPWWRDVLTNGRLSPFADYFDIDWDPPDSALKNRVLLPILDRPFDDAVRDGTVRLALEDGRIVLLVDEQRLPVHVGSCGAALDRAATRMRGMARTHTLALAEQVRGLAPIAFDPPADRSSEYARRQDLEGQVSEVLSQPEIVAAVTEELQSTGPLRLRRCLRAQAYELAWWKRAAKRLNYRRFFDINDLVGVRVEEEAVFEATHRGVKELADSDVVCGFRIDHVDGLKDPEGYLARLRAMPRAGTRYTVVEKILTGDETLPTEWPVEGTTGYEFLSMVNGLFIDRRGLEVMSKEYRRLCHTRTSRATLVHKNKRKVIGSLFPGEFERLARLLKSASDEGERKAESLSTLQAAITDVTSRLPVYRTYVRPRAPVSDSDVKVMDFATSAVPSAGETAMREAVLADGPAGRRAPSDEFAARWQQVSGAVMAKGFEDTTLYQDTTLLSLNDVGSRPDLHVATIAEFHELNRRRLKDWPHTLNCTATHDTKRGEDLRARLNVLTMLPAEWTPLARDWIGMVQDSIPGVDASMALLILQTILGTWSATYKQNDSFRSRMKEYITKAAREAKTHSSWHEPDQDYERSCHRLVDRALDDARVHSQIATLGAAIEFYGSVLSLSQVLMKMTCPGVPDFYQGSELWDLSLVDPDNRRPVDFEQRRHLLSQLSDAATVDSVAAVERLTAEWPCERAKLYLTHRALEVRARLPQVFASGAYVPLTVNSSSAHVCAFARVIETDAVVVAVPVRVAPGRPFRLPMGGECWGNTELELPAGLAGRSYHNALTGEQIDISARKTLRMAALTERFPVVLLTSA